MHPHRLPSLVLSAALVLSLAACGGDSDAAPKAAETTTSARAAGDGTTTTEQVPVDDQAPPTTNPNTSDPASPTDTAASSSDRPTSDLVVIDDESVDHNPVELAVGGTLTVRNAGQDELTCTVDEGALPPLVVSSAYADPAYEDATITFDEAGTHHLTCDLVSPVTLTVVVA